MIKVFIYILVWGFYASFFSYLDEGSLLVAFVFGSLAGVTTIPFVFTLEEDKENETL